MSRDSRVKDYPNYESKLTEHLNDMLHWQDVLTHLGIKHNKIQTALKNHRDQNGALKECLLHWVNLNVTNTKGTWTELFNALRKGGEAGVAIDLEEDIFSSESQPGRIDGAHAKKTKPQTHPATVTPKIRPESSGTFNENVKVVLLTANGNERETVRNFFGISSKIKNEEVKSYTYKNDPVLNGLKVEVKQEYAGNLTFDMINFGSIKVVHMKIGTSYGKDKARTAVRAILEVANVRNWPLEIIFCVGCCGCSSEDKSQNYRGNVLLSRKAGSYTSKFDGNELSFRNVDTYDMNETWFQRWDNCQPQDCQDHIHTTKADCIYSGDTVIAEENAADELRGYHNNKLIGIEMEGCGIAHELRSWDESRKLQLPEDMCRDSFLVVKGVSDHAGNDKNKKYPTNFFGQSTDPVDDDQRQEIATLHSVALVCRALRFIAKVD